MGLLGCVSGVVKGVYEGVYEGVLPKLFDSTVCQGVCGVSRCVSGDVTWQSLLISTMDMPIWFPTSTSTCRGRRSGGGVRKGGRGCNSTVDGLTVTVPVRRWGMIVSPDL